MSTSNAIAPTTFASTRDRFPTDALALTGGTMTGTLTTAGRRQTVRLTAISTTALTTDEVIVVTDTATVTLPIATGTGQTYRIICRAGITTIDGTGVDTVKGGLIQTLSANEDLIVTDTSTGIWE